MAATSGSTLLLWVADPAACLGGRLWRAAARLEPGRVDFAERLANGRLSAPRPLVLPDGVELHPGESIETLVRFFPWSRLAGELYPEREWIIQEGPRVVGFGRVVEVVRSP